MPAQDVETRTKVEIQEAAMNVLIEVLGGDDDSNIADALIVLTRLRILHS